MKRLSLPEFEDFHWFPAVFRSGITRLIVVFLRLAGTREVLVGLLSGVQKKVPFDQIIDMGSGSGGIMPAVARQLNAIQPDNQIGLLLTDIHPHKPTVARINDRKDPWLKYHPQSVDATRATAIPQGLRTMVNSFHHLEPHQARAVLKAARDASQPLLIYELAENKVPTLVWWLFLPVGLLILALMTLIMTPFTRPLTWQQLLFTYIIPVIPITYAWDGQASLMRTYTFADIRQLLDGLDVEGYQWEMQPATDDKGRKKGYFVLGWPVDGQ